MIALTTFSYNIDINGYEEKLKTLKKMYPGPVIHKILVFGVPGEDALAGTQNVIPILSSKISTVTSMGTVMCDITTDFLAELAVLSLARQMGSFKSPALKELEMPLRSPSRASLSTTFKPMHSHSRSGGSGLASPTGSFSSVHGRIVTSKTGSISLGLSDKTKSRQKGRMLKYLGSMYLISGHWQNALRDFTEAANTLKGARDHLWFASALEGIGICLVLLSFLEVPVAIPPIALTSSHHSFTPDTSSEAISPSSSHSSILNGTLSSVPPPMFEFLPELTGNILTYFARSQTSQEESVPQIVYCETILRLANLLAITRMAGGWNAASLSAIVRGTKVIKNVLPDSPSIGAITSWCNKAYGTDLKNMSVLAQANVYCGLAAIYSNIGLVRKRTFILRDLMVNIAPKIMRKRASNAASNGLYSDGFPSVDKQFISISDDESQNSLVGLLDSLCHVYGAGDVTSMGCGWSELRVSFLKVSLAICESLLDFVGVVHYAGLLLSTSADVLSSDEQLRISSVIQKAAESARTLGQGHVLASYWDSNLLRDIKMVQANTSIAPQYTSKVTSSAVDLFIHNPYSAKRASLDPQFRGSSQSKSDPIMVQNERVEFSVKLQNPFAFELHIYELTLLTGEDVTVKAVAKDIYVPARTIHEVILPVVPLGVGTLKILGCRIHVSGCEPRDFELIAKRKFLQDEKAKHIGVYAALGKGEKERQMASLKWNLAIGVIQAQPVMVLKALSLSQSWIMLLEGENQVFSFTVANISDVEANYVNLKFSDSTTQPLQVALNNKDLPLNEIYEVEYFLFNRKALRWKKTNGGNGEVKPYTSKTYEINILGKRGMTDGIIQVEYSSDADIASGRAHWSRTLSIPLNVTVNSSIELGGCDMIPLQHNQIFAESIENHELSTYLETLKSKGILSDYCLLVIDLRNSYTQSIQAALWSSPDGEDCEGTTVNANPNAAARFKVNALINAGRTTRLLIPVKRVEFTLEQLEKPIPNLSKRQYILDSQTSPERLRAIRENFWYRDALLKMLGGTWKVVGGVSRAGILELRGIRLSQKMINVLQVEAVRIKMSATVDPQGQQNQNIGGDEEEEEEEAIPVNNSETATNSTLFTAQAEQDFITISTTITNHTHYPLSGILRIIPSDRYVSSALDPTSTNGINIINPTTASFSSASASAGGGGGGGGGATATSFSSSATQLLSSRWENIESQILINGTLQRPIIIIQPGQSVTVSIGVLFLSRGEYEWTSILEETKGAGRLRQHSQRDPIYIKAV